MQHYSIPTNILDWSTSAFVAMYFALENEINDKEVKDSENAVIFLLNPIRLNNARELLKASFASRGKKTEYKFPILALSEDERFEEYLPYILYSYSHLNIIPYNLLAFFVMFHPYNLSHSHL